ncbi:UPF0721 transmembrane protein [Devosia pacifica]|uniref:Probable membrane transporter protein n=1 Tax=Devosia pacifica TaxID=1335967 RepID=A0A918VUT8_9HYPH|nr:sulfite exporter TauE/SafE family protein [Devosia pacifica]GHA31111.1 UPF0721 transmembrane protein [Devosia pacifica]
MLSDFLLFAAVGLLAQLVDGALGMAYGVISSTMLLAFGVTPAYASASAHVAEVFTTAASATSHIRNRNIDWRLFWRLAPAGVIGGILGAYLLTSIDGNVIRPYVTFYLTLMGLYILFRAIRGVPASLPADTPLAPPLGVVGGFADAAGGGGWGPVVTSTLVGAGGTPRYVIGTVNTAEFLLAVTVSATFLIALLSGYWDEVNTLQSHLWAVLGLIVGGVVAAPFAGVLVRRIAPRTLMFAVGVLVMALAGYQTWQQLA